MNPDGQTTVSPASLNFTAITWDTPQTVTVSAVDDLIDEGPHSGIISHTVTSGDPNYAGIGAADVTANISDNDSAGVSLSPLTVNVSENGLTATYAISLTSQPTGTVTVAVNPDGQTTVSPAKRIFNPFNWSWPQTVTVTAVDDLVVEGAHTGLISHSVTSVDTNYNGYSVPIVTAEIIDNDSVSSTIYLPLVFNNFVSPPPPSLPDLIVTNLQLIPITGYTYQMQLTVQNQGATAVNYGNNFHVNVYLNSNYNAPVIICGVQGSVFGAGQTLVVPFSWCTNEARYTFSSGTFTLNEWVDPYNVVAESNEGNNQSDYNITLAGTSTEAVLPDNPSLPVGPQPTPTAIP